MTALFLGALALAWIGVFLPAALRARQDAPLSSAEGWRRRMSLLAPRSAQPRYVLVPARSDRLARAAYQKARVRRIRILAFLATAAPVSGIVALLAGGSMWEVHLAFDFSLILYVALLLEAKRRRQERLTKVEPLGRRDVAADLYEGLELEDTRRHA
ncbi:MAG: hypothetical protein M3217_00230 [Actinomycetota bacterium]|nr:hypothetical protein [Actinomycetota bacterium]